MNPKHLFLVSAIFLLFAQSAMAQPGRDPSRFNPFRTCEHAAYEAENVFVGRVISLEEIPDPYHRSMVTLWKATVSVETILKGSVRQTAQVNLPKYPFGNNLSQIKGKKYIFIANRIRNYSFTGLFSNRWSTPLDEISPNDWGKILATTRSILRGVPEPRIMGRVIERDENAGARPLSGIVVVAEGRDGKQFRTVTDATGHFQIDKLPMGADPPKYHRYFPSNSTIEELPSGTYAVCPILPNKVIISDGTALIAEERIYIQISNKLCSAWLEFIVVLRK